MLYVQAIGRVLVISMSMTEKSLSNNVTGVDVYNMTTTGGVTMTISGAASDSHHIPTVIIRRNDEQERERLFSL